MGSGRDGSEKAIKGGPQLQGKQKPRRGGPLRDTPQGSEEEGLVAPAGENGRRDVCKEEGNHQERGEVPMGRRDWKNLRLLGTPVEQEEVLQVEGRKDRVPQHVSEIMGTPLPIPTILLPSPYIGLSVLCDISCLLIRLSPVYSKHLEGQNHELFTIAFLFLF